MKLSLYAPTEPSLRDYLSVFINYLCHETYDICRAKQVSENKYNPNISKVFKAGGSNFFSSHISQL